MKVALVYPEHKMWPVPSLGLLHVAASLERAGHEVEIFDLSREYYYGRNGLEEFARFISARSNLGLVGFGFNSPQTPMAYRLATITRELAPGAMIVFGGPHPTALPELTLRECAAADVIVLREAEHAMVELASSASPESVRGTIVRRGDGSLARTGPRELIADLDQLPLPAWHLIDMEYYLRPKGFDDFYAQTWRMGTIMTSRGCFGRCNFCFAWGMLGARERVHSMARVVQEIEHLIERYNINTLNIYDDTLYTSAEHFRNVCDTLINTGLNRRISFNCQLLAAQATAETLELAKEAGCYQIGIGFESFVGNTLKTMRKPASYKRNLQTVREFKRAGIRCLGYFMSGYDGEGIESIRVNQDLQKYADIDLPTWTNYVPFPGTKDFQEKLANGTVGDLDWLTFDMSQNPLTMIKRNYSSVPHGEYVFSYLDHLENFIFLRRFRNGIERRIARFSKETGIAIPDLNLSRPRMPDRLDEDWPTELVHAFTAMESWDLAEAHGLLKAVDAASLRDSARRAQLLALLFIHMVRMEDQEGEKVLGELRRLVTTDEYLVALARSNCSTGNYPNALRILTTASARGPEAARMMVFLAMLLGRPELVDAAAEDAIKDGDLATVLEKWHELQGTDLQRGLPDIFLRYAPNSEQALAPFAGRFDVPITPSRYRFLGYYLPLKQKLDVLGVKRLALVGFDRWTRMMSAHLRDSNDFELLGIVDDRMADVMSTYGTASIVSSTAIMSRLDPDSALIVTGEQEPDAATLTLAEALPEERLLRLFDNTALSAPNNTHQLYALSRELKGPAVLRV